jgi:glycosyltransferase involved in cell wall biosynthesis
MRILGGIPTRLRNTSGKIADVLAEVCDEVIVVSQGAEVHANSSKVKILERNVNYGLVPARNCIAQYAIVHDFDIIIQSDDDLAYRPEIVEAMVKEVVDNQTLGTIASSSRAYFHWSEKLQSTKNFVLSPCGAQLWAARTAVMAEIGPWTLEYLEDREFGARLWKSGYAIGNLQIDINLTHNPFIARTGNSDGGQEKSGRDERLYEALVEFASLHGDIVTSITMGSSNRTFTTRYDWNKMIQYPIKRFGKVLGYSDSRGRTL